MFKKDTSKQNQSDLAAIAEYEKLKKQYNQLSIKYKKQAAKYKAVKKHFFLASKQIQRWAHRYQRLKVTIAASSIETASFEKYAASIETNQDEQKRLKTLVKDLSAKNSKLEQELELTKTKH